MDKYLFEDRGYKAIGISLENKLLVAFDVALGMDYLIVHRDLKPQNVLVCDEAGFLFEMCSSFLSLTPFELFRFQYQMRINIEQRYVILDWQLHSSHSLSSLA